jgi:hypothetical protein
MALALDTTKSGETSNSYCDQSYADDYWANHYSLTKSAQWGNLSDGQKTTALIQATRVLESVRFTYKVGLPDYALHYDRHTGQVLDLNLTRDPVKYFYYQRLQFPRNLDIYYEQSTPGLNGQTYIRDEVMQAQCEQAMYLLNFDETATANRMQGITLDRIGLGKGQMDATQEYATSGTALAPMAYELLRDLMVRGGKLERA